MRVNFRKIKGFIHKYKWSELIVAAALVIAVTVVLYFQRGGSVFNPGPVQFTPKQKVTTVPATLTGLPVDPIVNNKKPIAVVVENHPDARPQSGYREADVVYETLAEGGITRTLAVFQSQGSTEIGPVRSARPYFIDWLSEMKAIFVHVGGDSNALDEIRNKGIPDINQFFNAAYFWRSTDRFAPHNVYTTTDKIYAAAQKGNIPTTVSGLKWYPFKKDVAEKDRPAAQKVTVNFSGPLFAVTWDYDPKTNDYTRTVAGILAKDKPSGLVIRAKNIVVQYESMSNGTSTAGEQMVEMKTIGSGRATIFQDGKAISAKWEKSSQESLTKLTDGSGKEIALNPGQTWFEVVPEDANVTNQ